MPHDPERQAGYLRQALAQGRRPIGFLLGAGCPVAISVDGQPLIPDIEDLTQRVRDELMASALAESWAVLEAQLHGGSNIEAILSHIRALHAVAGDDDVRGLSADALGALDAAICSIITQVAGSRLPDTDTPFHKIASWAGSSVRAFPVEFFTPNYDLLVEQALEETRVPYFDGFVGSVLPFFDLHAIETDELPTRWARLWKLHGSINWSLGSDGTVYRVANAADAEHRVIYPSHLKYEQSRRMPYLAFLDRLRAFLRKPSAVLITCGFSFRDQHLNEVLLDGAEGNASAMIFGLLHGSLGSYSEGIAIATTRSNLTLLARDGAVAGTRRDGWPQLEEQPTRGDAASIDWQQQEDDGLFTASFALGDFARFGALLAEIMGNEPIAASSAEAEASEDAS